MRYRIYVLIPAACLILFAESGCEPSAEKSGFEEEEETGTNQTESSDSQTGEEDDEPAERAIDTDAIEAAFETEGTLEDDVYKLKWPRRELEVTLDGFRIIPRMGLTAWAAFAPHSSGVVVTGDIPVRREELSELHEVVESTELEISAIHNHFFGEQPEMMFIHITGQAAEKQLAGAVRQLVNTIGIDPGDEKMSVDSDLDAAALDEAVGADGSMKRGVYKAGGTRDVSVAIRDRPLTHRMGFGWWVAIQGTMDEAAIAGDFVVRADNVDHALDVFARRGLDVVALHNHWVHDNPRLFYFHYWDTGSATELAGVVGEILDELDAQ